MFQNFNPLFGSTMVALGGKKVGKRRKRVKRKISRMSGGDVPHQASLTAQDGVNSYYQQAPRSQGVINTGRRSIHNAEAPLHGNAVTLKIKNNDAANRADLVLSAGRFAADPKLAPQLLSDGTQNYTNNAGDAVSVDVAADFGVDGTDQSWDTILEYIEKDGLAISTLRLEWTKNAQKMHKLRFERRDLFGDHTVDQIAPSVYFNPNQYHEKLIQTDVGFVLDQRTVVKYAIEPGEEVLMTLWVGSILELDRILLEQSRKQGGNSLT